MYIVYHGYISPDNCDCSESDCYELETCHNEEDVLEIHKEHLEATEGRDDVSRVEFQVFEGRRRDIVEKEKVTEYQLS